MTAKFIKIRVDETTRDAFQQKAKAEGVTMTQLIQNWIQAYLTGEIRNTYLDDPTFRKRIEALEEQLATSMTEPTSVNQETEERLQQYIHYLDQRIDTLENVAISPLKEDVDSIKSSWKALFNQLREIEGKVKEMARQLQAIHRRGGN